MTEAIMLQWVEGFKKTHSFPATVILFELYLQAAYLAGCKATIAELSTTLPESLKAEMMHEQAEALRIRAVGENFVKECREMDEKFGGAA